MGLIYEKGNADAMVLKIQRALKVQITGEFDNKTEKALELFQAAKGYEPTGKIKVGTREWYALLPSETPQVPITFSRPTVVGPVAVEKPKEEPVVKAPKYEPVVKKVEPVEEVIEVVEAPQEEKPVRKAKSKK